MISDPESIQRGFGPVCWAEMHPEKAVTAVDDVPEVVQRHGEDDDQADVILYSVDHRGKGFIYCIL